MIYDVFNKLSVAQFIQFWISGEKTGRNLEGRSCDII